jgi:hypothetical protein
MSWLSDAWDDVVDTAEDVGEAVVSVVEVVGDSVEGAVDAVAYAAGDVVDAAVNAMEGIVDAAVTWINENGGSFLGSSANVIGGIINGVINGIHDVIQDVINLVKDVASIVGSILRLDFGGAIQGLVDLFIDSVGFLIDVARFFVGGYIVGGVVRQFEREALRDFVKDLLEEHYGQDSALLKRIQDYIKLNGGDWGLPLTGRHYVLMLDSANTPLWQWQEDGTIDLNALAGVLSFDSFKVERPRTWIRVVGGDGQDNFLPVTRWVIKDYLDSKGKKRRLRVYAMDQQAVIERLSVAVDKCRKLGVRLAWDQGTSFYSSMFPVQEITAKDEYRFVLSKQESFVVDHGLRTGNRSEECILLALGAFLLDPTRFGNTAGRHIVEGADNPEVISCTTKGRDDSCCITIPPFSKKSMGSSVVHRGFWPAYVFRYILAHEIGHYLGLCHYGHNGIQNIMYTKAEGANLNMFDWNLFKFYYQREPEFTLADGKNIWRFIVDQLSCCLDSTLIC